MYEAFTVESILAYGEIVKNNVDIIRYFYDINRKCVFLTFFNIILLCR